MRNSIFTSLLCASLLASIPDAMAGSPEYIPGLGDIMGAIQMRHAKLWFAGTRGNWPLASYELGELWEGFEDAARFQPDFKGRPISHMIREIASQPLSDVEKAIGAKDNDKFSNAFKALTDACNSCHQAAGYGFISIRIPKHSTFSNQDFDAK